MERTDVSEVWGVGVRTTAKLREIGINSVAQLRDMPLPLARQVFPAGSDSLAVQANNFAFLNFRLRRFD